MKNNLKAINAAAEEIELEVETLEEVIAPGTSVNHNETMTNGEIALNAEMLEEVIAPGASLNHNEMLLNEK